MPTAIRVPRAAPVRRHGGWADSCRSLRPGTDRPFLCGQLDHPHCAVERIRRP